MHDSPGLAPRKGGLLASLLAALVYPVFNSKKATSVWVFAYVYITPIGFAGAVVLADLVQGTVILAVCVGCSGRSDTVTISIDALSGVAYNFTQMAVIRKLGEPGSVVLVGDN